MLFTPLETDRLLLKNIAEDDAPFLLRQFSDKDVVRYLFDEEPFTCLEDAHALIAFYTAPEPRIQHRWILLDKRSGERIGTCGFHCWNRATGVAEMGYDLQRAYWGRGLMTEAGRAVLRFARESMALREVQAQIYPENQRSIALARKLGFDNSGEHVVLTFRGVPYSHDVYSLRLPS